MKTKTKILMLIMVVSISFSYEGYGQAWKKLKEKAKKVALKPTSTKKGSSTTKTTTSSTKSTSSSNVRTTSTKKSSGTSTTNKLVDSKIQTMANYYEAKAKEMHNELINLPTRTWTEKMLMRVEQFNYPELMSKMKADMANYPEYFKLYPKRLPTSGMGTLTKKNMGEIKFAVVADANAEPPVDSEGKKIVNFYKEFCWWRNQLDKGEKSMATNVRNAIIDAEQAKIGKFDKSHFANGWAKSAAILYPESMLLADLKEEAVKAHYAVIEGFGKMITGQFHKTHMQKIVVFSKKPNFGSEKETDIVETIIPGESAYLTGYFTQTNKTTGGIPTLVWLNPDSKYKNELDPWGHTDQLGFLPMFNQQNVKDQYYTNAYFVFNLFPDLNTVNYASHVQYFPHLNFLKWLQYQPAEVIALRIKYGRNNKMANGSIKIDLSGDNKQKLKDYYAKLEKKRLLSVTYPDMNGCKDNRSKIKNFTDLSKYGNVLKVTLSSTGNIMKPWPNDHQIDWNTAAGFAAVEKSSGKVEVIPLQFRKRPTESIWQWWSIGTFPGLYPLQVDGTSINAVKKLELGYEIEKANVNKCGTWYRKH